MVLDAERWLELRRFRALRQADATISEIARETGLNWRTVKKYLEADGPAAPPAPPPRAERGKQVYSFHMVLSYSRDPFCCFTTSQDLVTFWACHRRAFAHFGGVPGSIVYDRTKTVVRRHVAPGKAVPLHPEAVAFAGHYGFDIDVLAAYRPTGKGRVERQVTIVRDHVLAGRLFASLDELDTAFLAQVPVRRAITHRTHGEVIGVRARRDHAALGPVPARPYVVAGRHLRHVGKDCLVAFEASLYSVPAARVFPRQLVEVRASAATISLHATVPDEHGVTLLAVHQRAVGRGARIVEPGHWDGLPDGHTRATTTSHEAVPGEAAGQGSGHGRRSEPTGALRFLLARADAAQVTVGHRPLSVYDQITGTRPFTAVPAADPKDTT